MKKFWLAPCCALGVALYAGTTQAAYWQVIRDTPVRTDAAADAKVLGTARKGWIMSEMTGVGSGPQWIKMVEFETKPGEGMAYAIWSSTVLTPMSAPQTWCRCTKTERSSSRRKAYKANRDRAYTFIACQPPKLTTTH